MKTHFACDEEFSTGAYPPTQEYSTGESLRRRFTNTNDEECIHPASVLSLVLWSLVCGATDIRSSPETLIRARWKAGRVLLKDFISLILKLTSVNASILLAKVRMKFGTKGALQEEQK